MLHGFVRVQIAEMLQGELIVLRFLHNTKFPSFVTRKKDEGLFSQFFEGLPFLFT
jgi:hypothetical protein